jgi:2-polyprenyl-3-methyl-5-hydroxy-6-metoxy-1,4-benzoquinol methylase
MASVAFGLEMLRARLRPERRRCPYCDSRFHLRLQRKWLVIEARWCVHCHLIFRYPTDDPGSAAAFYEDGYQGQQATDLPAPGEVDGLVQRGFRGTPYDKAHRVDLLRRLGVAAGRLLDFGAAWGYTVKQFVQAGHQAAGFEVSRRRAAFGRQHLGVALFSEWPEVEGQGPFDTIYAEHSLEHVPVVRPVLEQLVKVLRPGGRLVVLVPNGGGLEARRLGTGWGPFLGQSHTVAFTPEWFLLNLPVHGLTVESLSSLSGAPETLRDGGELACVARRRAD